MHINEFEGLEGRDLSDKQKEIFTAFLRDDADIGFANLRAIHVQAALYLAEQHAHAKGLKKWHPSFEPIFRMIPADEVLDKPKVLQIVALSWYTWGVLDEQAAFYGEHLIILAIFLFGYGCNRSCLRESDAYDDETPFKPAIHSLPYMRDWFTTSLPRDKDPMYSTYLSWLKQLKVEKESLDQLSTGSDASNQEATSLLDSRTERLRKAEAREEDWLVEWLKTSIKHDPQPPYNIFQAVLLQNPLLDGTFSGPRAIVSSSKRSKKRQRVTSK